MKIKEGDKVWFLTALKDKPWGAFSGIVYNINNSGRHDIKHHACNASSYVPKEDIFKTKEEACAERDKRNLKIKEQAHMILSKESEDTNG